MAVGVVPQPHNVFAPIYLRMRGPVLLTLSTSLRELGDCSTRFGLLCCFFLCVCVADTLFDDAPEHPCASFTNVLSNFRDMPCYIKCHYGVLTECSNTFDSDAMHGRGVGRASGIVGVTGTIY